MGPRTVRVLGKLGGLFLRLWPRLYRTEHVGWERVTEARKSGRQLVFCLWHGELLPAILGHCDEGIVTMASRSKDGEVIAVALGVLDYRVARGSTGKGGSRALDEMEEVMRNERRDAALTVDGPRGPVHVAQPGALRLASRTGAMIVPVGAASRRNRRLRSWDRFLLPLPFDRVVLVHGEPIEQPELPEEESCRWLEAKIAACSAEAELRFRAGEGK